MIFHVLLKRSSKETISITLLISSVSKHILKFRSSLTAEVQRIVNAQEPTKISNYRQENVAVYCNRKQHEKDHFNSSCLWLDISFTQVLCESNTTDENLTQISFNDRENSRYTSKWNVRRKEIAKPTFPYLAVRREVVYVPG